MAEAHRTADASVIATGTAQEAFAETRASNARQNNEARRAREDATRASQESARQANEAFQATIDNFHKDQRAWVSFQDVQIIHLEPGHPVELNLSFLNNGKTPAVDVKYGIRGGMTIWIGSTEAQIRENVDKDLVNGFQMYAKPIFAPQQSQTFLLKQESPADLDRRLAFVKQGTANFFVEGRIEYRDVSGTAQWMTFCLRLFYDSGEPKYVFCNTHNDMSYQDSK